MTQRIVRAMRAPIFKIWGHALGRILLHRSPVGCRVDEVAVVENATRAWDMAFYGLSFSRGDRILTARAEYASNVIAFLQVAQRTGVVIEVVENALLALPAPEGAPEV